MTDRPHSQLPPSEDGDFSPEKNPTSRSLAIIELRAELAEEKSKNKSSRIQTLAQWVGMFALAVGGFVGLVQVGACKKTGGFPFLTPDEAAVMIDAKIAPLTTGIAGLGAKLDELLSKSKEQRNGRR